MPPKKAKNRFITCEICGDRSSRSILEKRKFMAKFPLDETRCKEWVKVVGKEDLIYVPIEKLHELKYVCGSHFDDRSFTRKKSRLKRSAIPTKNLKVPLTDAALLEFPLHIQDTTDFQGISDIETSVSQVEEAIPGRSNSGTLMELSVESFDDGIAPESPAYPASNKAASPTPLHPGIVTPAPSDSAALTTPPEPEESFEDGIDSESSAYPTLNKATPTPLQCDVTPAPSDSAALNTPPEPVCRICLSSGTVMVADMDCTLEVFYDELIYHDTYEHELLSFCQICEYQLRRLYNFRQKCKRAHILLKNKGAELFEPGSIKNLQQMIPQSSITVCTAKSNQKVYESACTANNPETVIEEPELKSDEIAPSLTEYSFLVKKIGSDAIFKLEKADPPQNNDKTDLKMYIQNFLKDNDDSLPNDDFDVNDDDKENTKIHSKTKKQRKKKEKIKKPKLTKSEMAVNRKRKSMERFKQWVLYVMKRGELEGIEDLGVKICEEVVLKLLDKCPMGTFMQSGLSKSYFSANRVPKMRRFLQSVLQRYNPLYEEMFEVTYLNTQEKQLEEFQSRQHSPQYTEAVFKCGICYQVFELQGLLDFHMRCHDENKPLACSICSMRFYAEKSLKSHFVKSHRDKFSCKLCPFVTYNYLTMRNHFRDHKRFVYQCPDCDKKFTKRTSMLNHVRTMHRLGGICSVCGRRLASHVKLKTHIAQQHSDIAPEVLASTPTEQCDKCKAAFYTQEALLRHVAVTHRPTYNEDQNVSYPCFYCKIDFETVEALYTHKKSEEHRDAIKRLARKKTSTTRRSHRTCPLCNEEVLNEHVRSLYEHYRAAHPAAPYHAAADERDFLCEQCGQTFTYKHMYEEHMNVHTGAQPYQCSECGARFALRSKAHMHLRSHRRKLRGDLKKRTKFDCNFCPKIFKNKFSLERHILTHTGEKPHQCPMCDQRFTQASAIKLHITTVHLKLPAPYGRPGVERAEATSWKPRAGVSVPPMSLELLQTYVIGPWKNDLPRLKAMLDASKEDTFDANEEKIEDSYEYMDANKEEDKFSVNEEKNEDSYVFMDAKTGEMDYMVGAEEEVIEESCDSD